MSKQRKNKEDRKAAQRAGQRQRSAQQPRAAQPQPTRKAATPRTTRTAPPAEARPLTFGRDTYVWMAIGFGLVIVGLVLMSGGRGEDPNVFDESVIYSFRKITLAPLVILVGLGTTIYAILKK